MRWVLSAPDVCNATCTGRAIVESHPS